jgi:hypothetical protein
MKGTARIMRLYLLRGACRILAGAEVTHSPVAHLLLKGVAPELWITSAGALWEAKKGGGKSILNKSLRIGEVKQYK